MVLRAIVRKKVRAALNCFSETIENNVRSKITKSHFLDPAYFKEMSILLDALIKQRKKKAIHLVHYIQRLNVLCIIILSKMKW